MNEKSIRAITSQEAKALIVRDHYKHAMPGSPQFCFGFFLNAELVGCVIFGPPSSLGPKSVAPNERVLELTRLVVSAQLQGAARKNIASQLVSRGLRLLPAPSVVVSYADSREGHVGYVYQATNFAYAGARKAHHSEYIVDGKAITARTLYSRGISAPETWAKENGVLRLPPPAKTQVRVSCSSEQNTAKNITGGSCVAS